MMLRNRSYKKELLDDDSVPFADIRRNMMELDVINTWLGGHDITVAACKQLAGNAGQLSVCEIGCGGGDNIAAIFNWGKKKNIQLNLTGIDIKDECITYAKSRVSLPQNVNWIVSDYSRVQFGKKPDIIFSSLFCHHFTEEQLIVQFKWMQENSAIGFFINDLHRNAVAYYSIKWITRFFSRSYLVKNDAPLSVARGFRRKELEQICSDAGITTASIHWKWAFRYVVLVRKK